MEQRLIMYNFPGCPFSERLEILMALKGRSAALVSIDIDLSAPRPAWLLAKTQGSTALPAMDVAGATLKDSMVLMRYLDTAFADHPVAQPDPFRHALESMLAASYAGLSAAGYKMIQNRARAQCAPLRLAVDAQFGALDAFLRHYSPDGEFLFERFGWAETILTPVFKRLWFLDYYEQYQIPAQYQRLLRWRTACLAHPATQARSHNDLMKLYYDYSQGAASGRLAPGRSVSSFALAPALDLRPMPPPDKWQAATDRGLGLLP